MPHIKNQARVFIQSTAAPTGEGAQKTRGMQIKNQRITIFIPCFCALIGFVSMSLAIFGLMVVLYVCLMATD